MGMCQFSIILFASRRCAAICGIDSPNHNQTSFSNCLHLDVSRHISSMIKYLLNQNFQRRWAQGSNSKDSVSVTSVTVVTAMSGRDQEPISQAGNWNDQPAIWSNRSNVTSRSGFHVVRTRVSIHSLAPHHFFYLPHCNRRTHFWGIPIMSHNTWLVRFTRNTFF